MIKNVFTGCILIFFLGSASFAQNGDFERWDKNGDGKINSVEFDRIFQEKDYFSEWDLNNNDKIEKSEWEKGISRSYQDRDLGKIAPYSKWDKDGNGSLSNTELVARNFDLWDENDNGSITQQEFSKWNDKGIYD